MTFIEKSLRGLLETAEYAATAERLAASHGLLQRIDPRLKIASLVPLVWATAAAHSFTFIAAVFLLACTLAALSRIAIARLAVLVWTPVLFFTGIIALPAVFMTPGPRSAAFLLSRAETTATLSILLVLTTSWPRLLAALRWFHVPVVIVVILGMTTRYILLMLQTALDMLESRKSRTVGLMPPGEHRRLAAASVGVLLSKSMALSEEVHSAMLSRGFRGEIRLLGDRQ